MTLTQDQISTLVQTMVSIAEAAACEAQSESSDYSGMEMYRAKEQATEALTAAFST